MRKYLHVLRICSCRFSKNMRSSGVQESSQEIRLEEKSKSSATHDLQSNIFLQKLASFLKRIASHLFFALQSLQDLHKLRGFQCQPRYIKQQKALILKDHTLSRYVSLCVNMAWHMTSPSILLCTVRQSVYLSGCLILRVRECAHVHM